MLAANPATVTATAHPLGFVHVSLLETAAGRLRLHLWPLEPFRPQQPAWTVHSHGWPLTSLVIHGQVHDERHAVTSASTGTHRLYETVYEHGSSLLAATSDTVDCWLESGKTWQAGEAYEILPAAFHASRALAPSATVVWAGPTVSSPLVVGAIDGPRRVRYERHELAPDELAAVLDSIPGLS
jgi:hypothetical protein